MYHRDHACLCRMYGQLAMSYLEKDREEKVFCQMLLFPSDDGLRILSEMDLISEVNGTGKFLSKVSFDRLKNKFSRLN
jgi:hypothetical protein